jgi:hypothetical protein
MKNSLACVIFKGEKSKHFAIILRQLEKFQFYLFLNTITISTRFQLIKDGFHHFD